MSNSSEFNSEGMSDFTRRGLGWRIAISILTVFGWLAFAVIWLFFYAGDYSLFENVGVFIFSVLAFVGINAATWASIGARFAHSQDRKKGARSVLGAMAGVAWAAVMAVWFYAYAADFTIYQTIAVLIASLIVLGGANFAIHFRERMDPRKG